MARSMRRRHPYLPQRWFVGLQPRERAPVDPFDILTRIANEATCRAQMIVYDGANRLEKRAMRQGAAFPDEDFVRALAVEVQKDVIVDLVYQGATSMEEIVELLAERNVFIKRRL